MGQRRGQRKPAREPVREPVRGDREERRWIWFREQEGGRAVALEEFKDLPTQGRARLAAAIERYLAGEPRRHDVDHVRDGILELRTRVGNDQYRVLFFLWGPDCVALTALYKNQQRLGSPTVDRAMARRSRWKQAFGDTPGARGA